MKTVGSTMTVALSWAVLATGCGDPCIDDGFGGQQCLGALSEGAGSTAGSSGGVGPGVDSLDDSGTATRGGGGNDGTGTTRGIDGSDGTSTSDGTGETTSGTTAETTDSSSTDDSTSSGLVQLCPDEDGDGFADLEACIDADPDDPPPNYIPPTDEGDCIDTDPDVFPGAATLEPMLCTFDGDGDGWGTNLPPPGAEAGTDCDDGSPFTFPGAAQLEVPPVDTQCLRDEDDDGYGDATPRAGVTVGTDCADTNPQIFAGAAAAEPGLCTIDADSDGWGDWNAPALDPGADEGSDCDDSDAGLQRCALLITNDGTANAALDGPLVTVLEGLGLSVIVAEDLPVTADEANPPALVVISETALSGQVGDEFRTVDEGVIVMEGLIWDDMDMSPPGIAVGDVDVSILDDLHPIAAGLSGTVDYMLDDPGSGIFHTSPNANAHLVASRVTDPAQVSVYAFDRGAIMENAFAAPGRRVGLSADVDAGSGNNGQLGVQGLLMFEAAAIWALE